MRPTSQEFAPFYEKYVEKIKENDPVFALEKSLEEAINFLPQIQEERAGYRYAEGKWTVKELLQHLSDTERIMAYRALSIARKDQTELPAFDENAYVEALDLSNRSLSDIKEEFLELKKSTVTLFRSFPTEALLRSGIMNGQPASVRALAYIIAGHQRHHFMVLRERYF